MVIPKGLAKQIGQDGLEQERYERFAKREITKGARLPDVYPATEASWLSYKIWLEAGEPDD